MTKMRYFYYGVDFADVCSITGVRGNGSDSLSLILTVLMLQKENIIESRTISTKNMKILIRNLRPENYFENSKKKIRIQLEREI